MARQNIAGAFISRKGIQIYQNFLAWLLAGISSLSSSATDTCRYSRLAFNIENTFVSPKHSRYSFIFGRWYVSRISATLNLLESMQMQNDLSYLGTLTTGNAYLDVTNSIIFALHVPWTFLAKTFLAFGTVQYKRCTTDYVRGSRSFCCDMIFSSLRSPFPMLSNFLKMHLGRSWCLSGTWYKSTFFSEGFSSRFQ